ncbi:MAG: hypothetical protein E6259_03190, partial [Streptococcus sp.]|nr:hypothetical protein [Streptococcus sp.]
RCVCGKKIGPDPRNFNQRVSLGRNDLLIRTFLRTEVLESALAHTKNNEIIAAYNRSEYLAERTELMQWWGNYVQVQKYKAIAA